MRISSKIEPIDRDIALILSEELAPEARAGMLAQFAREQIGEVRQQNAQVIGELPDYVTIVDGRRGVPIDSVKAEGVIVAEFELMVEMFAWIGAQLVAHSPRLSGRYAASHLFLADGVEVDPRGAIPDAREYVFLNAQPYARKIDEGLSSQAPDGVYQAVTSVANRRFGNVASVKFGYRELAGRVKVAQPVNSRSQHKRRLRQPAIIIRPGR